MSKRQILCLEFSRGLSNFASICLFVSLLSHFWLNHFFHLRLLYQPYLGLCQAPCVQSHQRQPMSAVATTACEVQVSAADSQTVPTVVTGVSKPLCCRLTLTFTLTSVPLYYFYFYWSLYNYAAHAADILTLKLLSYKVYTITAEVCTVAAAIASASVGDVPVGYSTFHVDLAS